MRSAFHRTKQEGLVWDEPKWSVHYNWCQSLILVQSGDLMTPILLCETKPLYFAVINNKRFVNTECNKLRMYAYWQGNKKKIKKNKKLNENKISCNIVILLIYLLNLFCPYNQTKDDQYIFYLCIHLILCVQRNSFSF